MTDRVRAICFPHDDASFVASVQAFIGEDMPADEPLRATVEALLRERYPLALISVRHPFAALDDRPTWYVYRDGGLVLTEAADDVAPAGMG